jgi:hypothetical protein
MLKLVTIAGRVVLGAAGLLLVGCAYRDYDHGRYEGPVQRGYYERVDTRYGHWDRSYDRDGYRHRERYVERYGRCD